MSVLLSAGGPSERSRTVALLEATGQRLQTRGLRVKRLRVRDLNPQRPCFWQGTHSNLQMCRCYCARPILPSKAQFDRTMRNGRSTRCCWYSRESKSSIHQ
jgi:hypothetical protein